MTIITRRASRDYGVNWWLWRLATSRDIPDSYAQVRNMSFPAAVEAHAVIDALDSMREVQKQRAETDREIARRLGIGR